jgi:hypothetical protein
MANTHFSHRRMPIRPNPAYALLCCWCPHRDARTCADHSAGRWKPGRRVTDWSRSANLQRPVPVGGSIRMQN